MGLQKIINTVCARVHTLIMIHLFIITSDHYIWEDKQTDRRGHTARKGQRKRPDLARNEMDISSIVNIPTVSAGKAPNKTVSRRTQVKVRKDTKDYVKNLKMRRSFIQAENNFEVYAEGFDKKDIYGTPAFIWIAANAQ